MLDDPALQRRRVLPRQRHPSAGAHSTFRSVGALGAIVSGGSICPAAPRWSRILVEHSPDQPPNLSEEAGTQAHPPTIGVRATDHFIGRRDLRGTRASLRRGLVPSLAAVEVPLAAPPLARVLTLGCVQPPNRVEQEELTAAFRQLWAARHFNADRVEQLHQAVQVGARHLALPLAEYPKLDSFAKANDAFIEHATRLGEQAIRLALDRAGLSPKRVDHLFFVTVTGIATPSIEARLINRLGMRADTKRTPLFGLGCVAGAAALSRAADYLRAYPGEVAVLLSVELCSLTLQREDVSVANLIASGLFGDGAVAVVLGGTELGSESGGSAQGPRVLATRSVFYPDTEWAMGWDVVDTGFKVVLSAKVPDLAREHLRGDVDGFLESQGLTRRDIAHWVCHPGGPKVLEAVEQALELPRRATERSWSSLRRVGNLSSASVLFIFQDLLASGEARPGDRGLLLSMGPGFCSELVLLEW
ncbi:MAG: type III polyketide synthase [Deltaproteobacteria bacterium]|nr:type III polyketide synthase [Deltaproteobacteria bacterium]